MTRSTDDRDYRRGVVMAVALGLRRASGFSPPRWQLGQEYGTKTALGVYRTVCRLVREAKRKAGR